MPITKASSSAVAPAAKGDLVVGNATNDSGVLAVGTANQVLTVDSSTATGLKWAAAAAGGKLLQVVSSTFTSVTTITSASMTDTGIELSITPTLATSKILVFVNGMMRHNRDANFSSTGAQLVRDGSAVLTWTAPNFNSIEANGTGRTDTRVTDIVAIQYLDSPATTSAVTYKLQSQVEAASANATVIWQRGNAPSVMTLLEIGV